MVLAVGLVACAPDSGNVPKIADGARDALEQSKAVDTIVQQQADRQREDIERQSQ